MRLLRLFAASFSLSLRRELAFRANLLFQLLLTAMSIASGLTALAIVYTQTRTLGGWTVGEAIVLLGTYQIVSGVLATFIEPNIVWFAEQVRSGKLDELLLKPAPSIFLVSLGSCAPLGLAQVGLGGVVLAAGLRELGAAPAPRRVAAWLLLLAVAIAVTWASRVLLASLALWNPAVSLDVVYGAVWQFGRNPVSSYWPPLRFALTYVLPVAFIATAPARALTCGVPLSLLLAALAVSAGASAFVRLVWRAGLRRYTSATS
jgi:ABC-2 type transport system permease protein